MSKPEDKLFPDLKKVNMPASGAPAGGSATPPELPEEFKGKSPQELAAMLTAEREGRKKFETEMTGKFDQLSRTILDNSPKKVAADPDPEEEKPPNPRLDPEGYYNHLHRKNVAPLAREAFERFADIERDRAKVRFKDFDKYGDEIDAMVNQLPPELKAKRGSYETAYRIVKSQKLEEMEAKQEGREAAGFAESPSTPQRPKDTPRREYSDKERLVMKEFGMSEEEYTKFQGVTSLE